MNNDKQDRFYPCEYCGGGHNETECPCEETKSTNPNMITTKEDLSKLSKIKMTKTNLKQKIEKIFQDVENRGHYVGTDVYKISSLLRTFILKGRPKERGTDPKSCGGNPVESIKNQIRNQALKDYDQWVKEITK